MPDPVLISKSRSYSPPSQIAQKSMGILLVLALIFAVAVVLIYGGVYVYHSNLQASLDDATRELSKLEESFEPDKLTKISEVDKGLTVARTMLNSHVYSSNVFKFLQDNTLKTARYTNFLYSANPPELALSAETDGYFGLKRQVEIFETTPLIKSATFSGVTRDPKDGTVKFQLKISFDENLLRYSGSGETQ